MFRSVCIAAIGLTPIFCIAQNSGSNQSAEPTLRVTTRLVYVDVLVRDARGGVVKGLKAQDFKVLEDGHPQAIEFFNAHGAALQRDPSEAAPAMASNEFTNAAPDGPPRAVTVLLFDLLNTPVDDQLTARQEMLKFLRELPGGDPLMVFTLGNSLQMTQGIAGSQVLIDAASKMLRPTDRGLIAPRTESAQDAQNAANAAAQFGRHPGSTAGENAGPVTDATTYEIRARSTISALSELARAVADYPGRKSLYWLAEDFPLSIELAGANLNTDPSSGSAAQFNSQLTPLQGHLSQTGRQEMLQTLNELASARVAVYPTSVFGLAAEDAGASLGGPTVFGQNPGDPRGGFFRLNSLKAEMHTLALETGGEAFFGRNDIAGALLHSVEDSASYYTIAYKPGNEKWDGRFRTITIQSEGGKSLIYRRGYFATKDESATNTADDFERAMRPGAPQESALRLRSRILSLDPQHPAITIESIIDTADVTFTTAADGHKRAKLFVQLIAFSDAGQQPDRLPQTSGTLNIDLDPQRYQMVSNAGIAFRQQLSLKPGKYRLMVGVNDQDSHSLGTVDIPVTVPAS